MSCFNTTTDGKDTITDFTEKCPCPSYEPTNNIIFVVPKELPMLSKGQSVKTKAFNGFEWVDATITINK